MYQLVLFVHVVLCVALIVLVLIQHGKGADAGAAFGGGGASQTVFGSQGSGAFLLKVTGGVAALFFATSIGLAYMVNYEIKHAKQIQIPTTSTQTTKQK